MCGSTKYPYLPHGCFFLNFDPPPHPSGNFSLASHFPLKILAFQNPFNTSLEILISNDLPWGGYGYFLELHNTLLHVVASSQLPGYQITHLCQLACSVTTAPSLGYDPNH